MGRTDFSDQFLQIINKNKKFRSFKSKEYIHKKGRRYKSLISDQARQKYCKLANLTRQLSQSRHKRIGYDVNVMRQSACLVINPITVDNFAALFNCMQVDRRQTV